MSRHILFNSDSAKCHAESCLQLARQSLTSSDKARWLEMAQYWFGKSEQLRREEEVKPRGMRADHLDNVS